MKFRTTVFLGGKTATGLEVPAEVVEGLGSGKRPAVNVRIGDYVYRSTVAPMSGSYFLPLSAENRSGAGVQAGDEVEVELTLDTAPREVAVPDDFDAALNADPAARQAFDKLAYSHKRRHVLAIEDAKTPETRRRRIDKALEMLREGAK